MFLIKNFSAKAVIISILLIAGTGSCSLSAQTVWAGAVDGRNSERGDEPGLSSLVELEDPATLFREWPTERGASVRVPETSSVAWPPDRVFRSLTMDKDARGGSFFSQGDFGNGPGQVGVKLRFDGGPPNLSGALPTDSYIGGRGPGMDSDHRIRLNAIVFDRSTREAGVDDAHRLVLQADVELLAQIHTGGHNIPHLQLRNGSISMDVREMALNGHSLSLHGGVIDSSVHGNISSFSGIDFGGGILEFHDYPAGEHGIWGAGFSPAPGTVRRPSASGRVDQSMLLYLRGEGVLRWHSLSQQSLSPHNAQFGRTMGPLSRWDTSRLQIEIENNRYRSGRSDWEVWGAPDRLLIGSMRIGGVYPGDIRLVDRFSSTAGAGQEVLRVGTLRIEPNGHIACDGVSIICDELYLEGGAVAPGIYRAEDLGDRMSDVSGESRIIVGEVPLEEPAAQATALVTLEAPGLVSSGIFDPEGRLLRNLTFGDNRAAGDFWIAWDGLDDLGNPMPKGDYQWRILHRQPFDAMLVANPGVNHPEGPGRAWGGNHRGPESIASDADGYYIGFPGSEATAVLLALHPDGTRRWTLSYKQKHVEATEAMATDGAGHLAILVHPNGQGLNLNVLSTVDGRLIRRIPAAIDPAPAQWGWIRNAYIAAHEGVAVVTYRSHGKVRRIDLTTGDEIESEELAGPGPVTIDAEGVAWIVAKDGVFRWPQGGVPERAWSGSDLGRANAIAWDPTEANFIVAEGGGTHQVLRIDPQGRELARFGRPGGREFGPWKGENFLSVLDVAPDGAGGFLVVEGRVRRTAHLDAEGRLIAEWFGGQRWGHGIGLDPEDPTLGTIEGGTGTLCLVRMDHATRTWEMLESYAEPQTDGIFPKLQHEKWNLRRRGGRLFHLFADPTVGVALYEIDRENGKLVPRAAFVRMDLRASLPKVGQAALALQGLTGKPSGFAWSDANGNGVIEAGEVQFGAYGLPWGYNLHVADDWTLFMGDASRQHAWNEVPNVNASDPSLPPRWDIAARSGSDAVWPERFFDVEAFGNRPSTVAIHRNDAGETWSIIRGHGFANEDRQGGFWPEFYGGSDRIVKWNPAGEVEWVAGRHIGGRGRFTMAYGLLGSVHGNIVVRDRFGVPTSIWSEEGLYAGNLLESWSDTTLPPWVYDYFNVHDESLIDFDQHFNGLWTGPDGTVYYGMQGRSSTPVFRIDGWDTWTRMQGTISLSETPPAAVGEGTGLTAEYFPARGFDEAPALVRVDPQIWFEAAPQITGGLIRDTWGTGAPAEGLPTDNFSIRWTGEIEARFSETYRLVVETDVNAQVSVWLNGERVIFDDGTDGARRSARIDRNFLCRRNRSAPIKLEAGVRYPIRVESIHGEGGAGVHLMWESRTQERLHVPARYLYPADLSGGGPMNRATSNDQNDVVIVGTGVGGISAALGAIELGPTPRKLTVTQASSHCIE